MKNEKRKDKKEKSNRGQAVKNCSLLLVFCSLLLVLSCENPAASKDNVPPIPSGKGSFSLTLSDAARTILPVTPNLNDFAVYNLSFTPTNGGSAENVDRTNETLATEPVFLDIGTYKLVVNAYKDNNKTQLVAQGTLNNITITAGQNTPGTVTLEALLSGGTGTFRWGITVPTGVTANMIISPGNVGGTNQQTVTLSPPTASGSRILNSGQYSLTFNLTKTDGKAVVWNELLYVYQNLESVFSFEFTDTHLSDSVYSVTYNYNDGVTSNQTQSVLHGATLTVPTAPTKNGYTFGGWYTDDGTFANAWNFDISVIESFTLYAKWNCTVTFDANGGSGTAPSAQTVQAGSSIILPSGSGLSRTGFTFGGWNTNTDGTGTNYNADSSYTPTGNITLYARWYSTITYNINGGSGTTPSAQTADYGFSIILPSESGFSRTSYVFGGWNTNTDGTGTNYSAGTSFLPSGDITLYAKWYPNAVPGTSLAAKLAWLQTNALSNVDYTVEVTADESIEPHTLSYNDRSNITITLIGTGANRTVSLSSNGAMFTVSSSVTLVLDNNITLQGHSDNTGRMVFVDSGGVLMMNDGTTITGNRGGGVYVYDGTFTMNGGTISVNSSGGVYVASNGTFTMNGGTISGNGSRGVYVASNGTFTMNGGTISSRGVYVDYDGAFIMEGGTISGNTASDGGGVYVNHHGAFIMEGGTISGNTASASPYSGNGGGVYVYSYGTFTMSGGEISGNTAFYGGGVYVASNGTFTMENGTISGNSSGGVYVSSNGTFTMNDGEISGNTATNRGGGVYVSGGTFTMSGGTISGNTAYNYSGGGVYVETDGTFIMENGTISGNSSGGVCVSSNGGTFTMSGGEISGNTGPYVGGVYVGGTFTMEGGTIFDNTVTDGNGGGVCVEYSGTFTMTGGTISGNTANPDYSYDSPGGGGVYLSGGTFTMEGGTISGNIVSNDSSYGGGGVAVDTGTFTMKGGEISGNTSSSSFGGGVYVRGYSSYPGTITMSGGTISGNTARSGGGGVYVYSYGTFTMEGGKISGNTAFYASGGGVAVDGGIFTMIGGEISGNSNRLDHGGGVGVRGTFTMEGGTISGNTASYGSGGGVYVGSGTFTMSDGTISGNTSSRSGGGVYVLWGTFDKTGGTITGYISDTVNGNVVKNSSDMVVNDRGHALATGERLNVNGLTYEIIVVKRRETTAGLGVNLSFDYNGGSPTWSEGWDD